jgi:20S proteasome alpha/beta subunit
MATFRRLRERSDMTIALGILARNGVVIAADREESAGDWAKYEANKIRGAFRLSKEGHRHLLLVGAGWADYIDAFAQTIEDDGILKDPRLDEAPKAVFEEALERFYARKVLPFSRYRSHERPAFEIVLGYIGGGRSHLFVSCYNTLKRAETFAVIGTGSLVARPILLRFMSPSSGARSVSVREAVVIATYAAREAKDAVPGVGKDTDILAMFDSGRLERTVPPMQDPLDAVLQRYGNEVAPTIVRSIIGTRATQEAFAEIEAMRAAVQKILGDSFNGPATQPDPKGSKDHP